MIFPFLPFMIHDFFPYLDKSELGKCSMPVSVCKELLCDVQILSM